MRSSNPERRPRRRLRPAAGGPRRAAVAVAAGAAALLALASPAPIAAQADTVPQADTTPPALPPADTTPPAVPPADTTTPSGQMLTAPGSPGGVLGAASGPDSVQVVDRVVAVAGDSAILLSEVQEDLYRMRQQGLDVPDEPAARDSIVKQAVSDMIDRLLLVQRARQEGVTVSDDQVDQVVEQQFDRIRSNFQSDEAFRQAVEQTGQNMYQYRQMLRSQARQQILLSQFRQQLIDQGELPPASVSDSAVRAYFDSSASTARRPATVSFQRITVVPRPDSAAADSALQVAKKALDEIHSGTDFAVVARRYSDDPGTRAQGGDMGWIRRSDVVPGLANALWAVPPGRAVGPIQTRFGYHIVKVENVRGGEREVRQILIRPRIDSSDVAAARERADSVADSLRAGADPERLGREYGIPDQETSFKDVEVSNVGSRFGQDYATALGQQPGDGRVVGPFRVEGAFDLAQFVVLRVTDFKAAGPYRFEDVRDQIRQQLLRQEQFREYMVQLRRRMYVKLFL
ncbi:MAG TPA: peptidylprolyl isomerase [Gemmatimonadota bacterium]|nr:peptidylprolyl isomerase [Gemmatimonadota bacterium]